MKQKHLTITILTLFPDFINSYMRFGIIARAVKNKLLKINAVNLRNFSPDKRGTVDGRPYGGGVGMVFRPDVMITAIGKLKSKVKSPKSKIILLTPQGKRFEQKDAKRLAKYDQLIFISGRYEGFDERIRLFVDEELSVGDYILMGGELPSLVVSEAVLRLVPGVLGKLESTHAESFSGNLLEYPQYTKPEVLRVKSDKSKVKSYPVPKVLLTGNHKKIEEWREKEALKRTKKRRPDLFASAVIPRSGASGIKSGESDEALAKSDSSFGE